MSEVIRIIKQSDTIISVISTGPSGPPGAGPLSEAIEDLATAGLIVRIDADEAAARSIAVGSSQLSITNPTGVSGNPTLDFVPANVLHNNIGSLDVGDPHGQYPFGAPDLAGRNEIQPLSDDVECMVLIAGADPQAGTFCLFSQRMADGTTDILSVYHATQVPEIRVQAPLKIYKPSSTTIYARLRAHATQAASFDLTLPDALPVSGEKILTLNSDGQLGTSDFLGLNDLTDVDLALPPATGDLLYWDGSAVSNADLATLNIAEADDLGTVAAALASHTHDHGALTDLTADDHTQYVHKTPSSGTRNLIESTSDDITSLIVRTGAHVDAAGYLVMFAVQLVTPTTFFQVVNNVGDITTETGDYVEVAGGCDLRIRLNKPIRFYESSGTEHGKLIGPASMTSNKTWTLPDATGTVALLERVQTWTVSQTMVASSLSAVPLTLTAAASQTANLLDIKNSAAAGIFKVNAVGYVGVGMGSTALGACVDVLVASSSIFTARFKQNVNANSPAVIKFIKNRNNGACSASDRIGEFNVAMYDTASEKTVANFGFRARTVGNSNSSIVWWIGATPGWNSTDGYGDSTCQIMGEGVTGCVTIAKNGGATTPPVLTSALTVYNVYAAANNVLVLVAHSSQSADVFETRSSAGVVQRAIGPTGLTKIKAGVNLSTGVATLVAGEVTVSNTLVAAGDYIHIQLQTPGGTPGICYVLPADIVAATSFKITSTNAADTSTVIWEIKRPL